MNPNLQTWLETAHKNLVPEAQKLVSEQILEHFTNALERYQLEGKSVLEAEAKALADLGDSRLAAKKFEQSYLTNKELGQFESSYRQHKTAPVWFFVCFLGFVPVQFYFYFMGVENSLLNALQTLFFGLYFLTAPLLARYYSLKQFLIRSTILSPVFIGGICICLDLSLKNLPILKNDLGQIFSLVFLVFLIVTLPKYVSSIRKIANYDNLVK